MSEQLQNDSLPLSEGLINTILDTAVDAIITIDTTGKIRLFNKASTAIFGYEPHEVVGRNVSILMPSPFKEMHNSYIQRYIKTGKASIIGIGREVIGQRRDGSTFPLDLAVSEVGGGEQRMFVGILRDISERKYLEKALVNASENERREIGRDLHDALGQIITGISLLAKSLAKKLHNETNKLAQDADSIASLATDAMTEAKRLAYGAYPTELERQGLVAALLQIMETTRRLHGIETHFSAPNQWKPLEPDTELHLYRIAQESVANAIKHGKPKNLRLSLQRDEDAITLMIIDDGSGLPPQPPAGRISMGLDIMRHRAKLIGGAFSINNRKSGGVEVKCCIPTAFLVSRKAESKKD
ncbi:MAG TPA: PAS domain S-box protein [Kiritimatiellia bacterium]|nr:PAS domain S-box protein [Kiritimatiellia bacterium]